MKRTLPKSTIEHGRSAVAFHGPAQYAHQLLIRVVNTLATAPGDVRSRILQAYLTFHPLTPEHFPEELRAEFKWIMEQLAKRAPYTNYDGRIQKSSAQVSLEHMRNSTGVKIAEKLLHLHYAVDNYVNKR